MKLLARLLFVMPLFIVASTLWPADAAAQRRGHRVVRGSAAVIVAPYYSAGFYDPFFWGYRGWYPYGFYGPYYPPDFYRHERVGSARLQVTPREAEVYVDGYLVGTVDDFDGFLQRLDVPAGEHDLTLYLEGYRTVHQKVLFRPGSTVKITATMEHLPKSEATEPRPRPERDATPPSEIEAPRAAQPERETRPAGRFGTLAIRVQPSDADVIIDGEPGTAPPGAGPLQIELGEGTHDVEVRKSGMTTYRTTIRVRGGETVTLNVSLR